MTNAAVECCVAISIWGVGVNGEVCKRFGNPFKETMRGKTNEVEWEHLEFFRDSVKVFFFVFIDMCEEFGFEMENIVHS